VRGGKEVNVRRLSPCSFLMLSIVLEESYITTHEQPNPAPAPHLEMETRKFSSTVLPREVGSEKERGKDWYRL